MTNYADGVAEKIIMSGIKGGTPEYFAELTRRTEAAFPAQNPNRGQPSSVETGGSRTTETSTDDKSYENLPADAKAACDRFVKNQGMKQEDYVASYDWD